MDNNIQASVEEREQWQEMRAVFYILKHKILSSYDIM